MNYDLIQTITGVVGLITIFLLWWQIKSQLEWNKINLSLNKVDTSLLKTNGNLLRDFGIDMKERTMTNEDYNKLIDDQNRELLFKAREILDMLEDFSALYNIKVLNKFFAYESYSEDVLFFYSKFNKIIDFYRDKNDPSFYKNLEICASEFSKIRLNEQKNMIRKLKKIEKVRLKTMNKLEKIETEIKLKLNIIK